MRTVRSVRWVFALFVGSLGGLGLFHVIGRLAVRSPCPPLVAEPAPVVPIVAPAPPPEPESEPIDRRGSCATDLLPASMVQAISDDDAADLAALVERWTASHETWRPAVVYRRGVVHVESEEDRGDDPPYPRSADAEAQRACRSEATWLRSHVRHRLADSGFVCEGNVCCYGGSEYSPVGYVVFHGDADATWSLDAWVQLDIAALAPYVVDENVAHVTKALRQLEGGRCTGEPPGHD